MDIPNEFVLQMIGTFEAFSKTLMNRYQAEQEKDQSSRITVYFDGCSEETNDLCESGKQGGETMPPRYADGYLTPKKNGFRYVFYHDHIKYDIWRKTKQLCFDYRTSVLEGKIDRKKTSNKDIKLSDWLNEWYETYKAPYNGEKSLKSLKYYAEKAIDYFGKDKKISQINGLDAQKYINLFSTTPNTQRKQFLFLRGAFEKAFRLGKIKMNPFFGIELMPHKDKSYRALNPDEQQKVLKAIKNPKYYALFFFCCTTGIRIDRVLNLTKENFNLEKHIITVKKKQRRGLEETYSVPFLPRLLKIIDIKSDKKIFEGITYNSQKLYFARLYNDLGIEEVSAHSLRHTFISSCYSCGIDIKTIQTWAGHANVEITLNRYTHLFEKGNSEITDYIKELHDTLS